MQAPSLPTTPPQIPSRRAIPQKRSLWIQILSSGWSYVYLTPMLILLVVFVIYPIFASLTYSFYQWNGIGDPTLYVGLDNFTSVIHDSIFWGAFLHTFIYMATLVPIQLFLALILALVLNNPKLRFSPFYRSVYFIPAVTSAAVVGVVFQLILADFGNNINQLLLNLHIIRDHIDWLGDPRFALGCVIVIGIWNTLGYNMVYLLAGLQTIPAELYEAARIDGTGAFGRLFYITLPQLRGIGIMVLILSILGSLQVFDLVQVLTHGGPYFATEVVNTYIYHQAFGDTAASVVEPNVGFASAASFFYGLILLALSIMQYFVFRIIRRQQ
ncbi:carbohydrate ABC transporter permease [Tengunoibacter tsumagoiensis]|uniref:ABC transporter permease n=1 Tax=Tengunoibacter tsumagoiensis TaxID=2014871 RepID=A0A402A7L8_9CHLR|nr:sugar ABC transporter permease [Tengunoibacter tsumagoiensis]GCE15133.1 ABC transporter permease [Tengunoibacter tsumagoiensis]